MNNEIILLDGAMGTYIHSLVENKMERVDYFSIYNRKLVYDIHREYIKAGAKIINTNTFISNYLWNKDGFPVEEAIKESIIIAKKATSNTDTKVALDIGPSKSIEENNFERLILLGERENVDLYIGETFMNLEEVKLLIKKWKRLSKKPLIVSFSLEKDFRLSDGSSLEDIVCEIEKSGVVALGLNCGYGLSHCYEGIKRLRKITDMELMAKPNIGYETISSKNEFLFYGEKFKNLSVKYIGGCCQSTPDYIYELKVNLIK